MTDSRFHKTRENRIRRVRQKEQEQEEQRENFENKLIYYIKNNDIRQLELLFQDPQYDKFREYVTDAVLYAVKFDNKEALHELIKWGAYIDFRSSIEGMESEIRTTPLGYAIELHNLPIIRMLIRAGASPDILISKEWNDIILENNDLLKKFTETNYGLVKYVSYLLLKEERSSKKDIKSLIRKLNGIVKEREKKGEGKIPFFSEISVTNENMILDYPQLIEFFDIKGFEAADMASTALENDKLEAFAVFLSKIDNSKNINYTYLKNQIIEKYREGDREYADVFLEMDQIPQRVKEEVEREIHVFH